MDTREPLVSVICPVFNGIKYFDRAIPSILNQSYKNFEFLIIDDGSTDGTSVLLENLSKTDDRIRVISPGRVGFIKALNIGLNEAKGELIARQDFDDISYYDRLDKQVRFMIENPEIVWSSCSHVVVNSKRNEKFIKNVPLKHDNIVKTMIHSIPWAHTLLMFRKSIILHVGGYPSIHNGPEDLKLGFNLIKEGYKMGNIEHVLGEHEEHSNSFFNSTFKDKERNTVFIKIQIEAINDLRLPIWYLFFPYSRYIYMYMPSSLKRIIRFFAGQKEQKI